MSAVGCTTAAVAGAHMAHPLRRRNGSPWCSSVAFLTLWPRGYVNHCCVESIRGTFIYIYIYWYSCIIFQSITAADIWNSSPWKTRTYLSYRVYAIVVDVGNQSIICYGIGLVCPEYWGISSQMENSDSLDYWTKVFSGIILTATMTRLQKSSGWVIWCLFGINCYWNILFDGNYTDVYKNYFRRLKDSVKCTISIFIANFAKSGRCRFLLWNEE